MAETTSLSARVALGTALAAAVASLVAAIVTVLVADRLVVEQEERRLSEIAALALRELTPGDHLADQIADEVAELAPDSIRIAVYQDERLVGGDGQLPNLPGGACTLQSSTRACAARRGPLRVVAAAAQAPRSMTSALYASAIAVLIAALTAALIGRRTTRWALRPLFELRDSLSSIKDDPRSAKLAGDDSVQEIAALRSALADLMVRLGVALDAARRFSADAAHELKTPLTAIRAELDLLAEESLDAQTAAAVERLRTRVIALTRLIERLLVLAKVSARADLAVHMEAPARGALDTDALEAVALEDIVTRVASPRVRLAIQAPGMVNGDELLLTALVENAVENALKFSGSEAMVDVRVSESDGQVILEVIDEGPGLSKEEHARAFEPFFRAASARASIPGHGIGLALVAQVAAAHGGKAEFAEPKSRGAHLRVTFPAWSAR